MLDKRGLLVLSRKVGESLVIGEGDMAIEVRVVLIQGNKVRLSFDAPKSERIVREELMRRKSA